jgi:hypothetical protein
MSHGVAFEFGTRAVPDETTTCSGRNAGTGRVTAGCGTANAMDSNSGFFLWFLVILAVVATLVWVAWGEYRRAQAFRELALRLRLNYLKGSQGIPQTYDFLSALDHGDNRYASNILSGFYRNHEILAFDYRYSVGSGKNKRHIQFTFFMLRLPRPFPELRVYPENLFSKIGQTLGFEDIDFESVEFSRAFVVRSPDKKYAYDICHARMMEYLLNHRDRSIEIKGEWITTGSGSKRVDPENITHWLNMLVEIRELFPQYLFA